MTTEPLFDLLRLRRSLCAAVVLVAAAWLGSCQPAGPTSTGEPMIEVIEGTRPATTHRAAPSATLPGSSAQPASPTPAPTQVAFASPRLATTVPPLSGASTLQPSAPANATATPTPATLPGATPTPRPTANLTLPPSLTPPGGNPNNSQSSPTPSRTPTPTPTATTASSACQPATQKAPPNAGWTINRVCIYQWASGEWEVYGELTNNTGSDQIGVDLDTGVDVEVNFYDSSGAPLATNSSWLYVLTLPNGATAPFAVPIYSASAPAQVDFSVSSTPATVSPRRDLQVVDGQAARNGPDVILTGQLTNPGADLADFAEIIVTFYGQNGAVIAVGYETIRALDLASGQTAPFQIYAEGQPDLIDLNRPPLILALGY